MNANAKINLVAISDSSVKLSYLLMVLGVLLFYQRHPKMMGKELVIGALERLTPIVAYFG